MFGRNSQPSLITPEGAPFKPTTRREIEEALHFAKKHEQRVWGTGSEHEKAHAEVERLEALLETAKCACPGGARVDVVEATRILREEPQNLMKIPSL